MKPGGLKWLSACLTILLWIIAYVLSEWKFVFYSNLALGLAASSLSILITLGVVQWALKIERDERNSTKKRLIFKRLLYHIINIINTSPVAIVSGISYIDSKLLNDCSEKIRHGVTEPNMEVAEAMVKLIDLIEQAQQRRKKFFSELRKQEDNKDRLNEEKKDASLITLFYRNFIIWRINTIREMIPRILEIEDDKDLEQALLNFERISDRYDEDMRLQMQSKDYPIHSERLMDLLRALAALYILIAKKMDS